MAGKITPEIMSYINEIAEKMKNGRASLMIGAGFSKNAVPNMPTNKNITVINMAHCFKEKAEPKIGLDLFVETLSKLNSKNDSNNWPTEKRIHIPIEGSDIKEDLKKLIIEWKKHAKIIRDGIYYLLKKERILQYVLIPIRLCIT